MPQRSFFMRAIRRPASVRTASIALILLAAAMAADATAPVALAASGSSAKVPAGASAVADDLPPADPAQFARCLGDRKSTRLNSSHVKISYAVFCLKKKKKKRQNIQNRAECHTREIYGSTEKPSAS